MKNLNGCLARDGEEIDGEEFEVADLREFIKVLHQAWVEKKQVHLNYFDDEDDLDIWLETI
jgi:hypothetical protein